MNIVNAVWEKENIGLECRHIVVDVQDNLDTIKAAILQYQTEYTIIKLPIEMLEAHFLLQEYGYTFIEMMTTCHYDCSRPLITNNIQNRLKQQLSCAPMGELEIDKLMKELRNGLLAHDGMALDPYIGLAKSSNRYANWTETMIKNGTIPYAIYYKGEYVGFFFIEHCKAECVYSALGGIFTQFQRYGIGTLVYHLLISEAYRLGNKKVYSAFSSNNRGAYANHMSLGFQLDKQYYVFVKH